MRTSPLLVAVVLLVCGCTSTLGPTSLGAVEGRLIDRETRAGIAGAEIVQVYRGRGAPGAEPPVQHARWTVTDVEGRFVFDAESVADPGMWLVETYAPRYDVYHPAYGLVRGPTTEASRVLLEATLRQAEQRRMDLRVFCSTTRDDAASRHLREIACEARKARPLP